MFGFSIIFKLRTWLVLGALAGLLYLAYLFVPAVREGAEEVGAAYTLAVPQGMGATDTDMSIKRFNMEWREGKPPFYVDVPRAYINRSVRDGSGWGGNKLHLIVSYPSMKPQVQRAPTDEYSFYLRISYAHDGTTHKEYYLKDYDIITSDPDEKIGHLYGYITGQGPEVKISIDWLRKGDDKWFYLDKETNTFARFNCGQTSEVGVYFNCVGMLLIDDRYLILTSIPGPLLRRLDEFINHLRNFLYSLEVKP